MLVRARRRALAATTTGRVLDLGGSDSHRGLWAGRSDVEVTLLNGAGDPRLRAIAARGETFDTVVSILQLTAAPDATVAARRVATVLADDGSLRFLEPAVLAGVAGRGQRLVAPSVSLVTGMHLRRDIPRILRDADLSVVDLDRVTVPTMQWWLRQLLDGRAHHRLVPGRGSSTATG